ncbi:MAG TPA: hypothetical protein VEL79_02255 [Vicinamibacterales bacterium]|nr:hypothetical protein [Vicinamibacterales bacterium]
MIVSRRRFLGMCAAAPFAAAQDIQVRPRPPAAQVLRADERERVGRAQFAYLRRDFPDLRRHFVFEYYPWYGLSPFRHWEDPGFDPPVDITSRCMPLLGAYDSRDAATLERHARWIADAGVGAINVSWWGRDSYENAAVPLLMDVMRAHDIHVTFHLEPYADDRGTRYASDILYLLREYGERRRWDALLLLANADGKVGPVFKSFGTILPPQSTDCHGVTAPVPNYVNNQDWHRQTDLVRETVRDDFDHVTLLADTLDPARAQAGGFDGIAVYDPYVEPSSWPNVAAGMSSANLVFSFNINPGFDRFAPRVIDAGSCYRQPPFEPPTRSLDFSLPQDRALAMSLGQGRIEDSFGTTIVLQTDPALANRHRGFFLVFVNSFNEWHEGHEFEPMKNFGDLTPAERRVGYHNADDGSYRLQTLKRLLEPVIG